MRIRINHVAVAIAIALAVFGSPATAQREAAAASGASKIMGTWNMQVTFVDCTTGAPQATGLSLVSFAEGGVITELASGAAPASRHPGLGTWKYLSGRRYAGAFKVFRYNPDGTFAGKIVVNQDILYEADDTLNIAAVARFHDAAGNLLFTRCVSTVGTRFTGDE